jgi:tetratricopeptide (TPR) repeat protein
MRVSAINGGRWALVTAAMLGICSGLVAQDKGWTEVKSPHFRVITDASDRDGREVAAGFEKMRAVFASQFPGFLLEAPAPLLILGARDEDTMKLLYPQMFKARIGSQIGGMFQKGWEREYAVARLDMMASERMNPDTYATIYHEYVHSLLHANFRGLPTWLDEGLAEFYAYTRFEGNKMYIGAPSKSKRLQLLDARTPTPIRTLIAARSSISRDQQDSQLFYAEAWALTHFLTFGPGMQQGDKLKMFFNQLQRGTEQMKAFELAFGNVDEVDKQFLRYINQIAYPTGVVPYAPQVEEKDYAVRKMSLAETQAELGAFHARSRQFDESKNLAQAALKADPKLALAHEDLGFALFNEGKDEDALRELSQAVDLDAKDYLALFAKTMMSPKAETAADQAAFREALMKVLAVNPRFAPAHVELAKLDAAKGDLNGALQMALKAENAEPFRSGYRVLAGRILLAMGRYSDASARAAYVAARWGGPDHDEAMELWNSIPEASRAGDAPTPSVLPKDWMVADGVVKSVTCKDADFTIVEESAGKTLTFHRKGFPVGYSDTLWVGRDHFTPCYHVTGLRAVTRYKASSDKTYDGETMMVGFRDNLTFGGKSAEAK